MFVDIGKDNGGMCYVNTFSELKFLKIISLSIFLAILIFPLTSAVEFQLKEVFDKGETLLAKVSGNFLEQPGKDNVFFYRGTVRIPVVYAVARINDEFYIYALLTGKDEGNYSVALENVRYMKGAEISEEDIVRNFIITGDTADFSVNPGFLITSEDFSLELQNLQESRITVKIIVSEKLEATDSLDLKSGETKKINFKLNTQESFLEEIKLRSENINYSVPVFIFSTVTTEEKKDEGFEFQPGIVSVSMATDSDAKRIIYLVNTGKETIENIIFSVSGILEPYVTLSPETINDLEENSTEKLEIFLISDTEVAVIEGKITAHTENFSTSVTLVLNFIKDYIPAEGEDGEVIVTTCEQLEGVICDTGYECSEDIVHARDGICCLAQCQEVKESSTGKIMGWLIITAIILALFWFFKKRYFGVKRKIGF